MGYLFPSIMQPGQNRSAGAFMDGNAVRVVMVINDELCIFDVNDMTKPIHAEAIGLGADYMTKTIACLRSANTGKLVVVLGGYRANTTGQEAHPFASDYFVKAPVAYPG